MLRLTDVIQPKSNERIEGVFRRHRGALFLPLLLATLLIVVPFFFLFSLTHAGAMGVLVLVFLPAIGLVVALRSLYSWDANALIITNQRLVRVTQNGLLNRVVQEVPLAAIHELSCESRGLWETVFRIGTLRARAAGSVGEIMVPYLASPTRARTLIESLRPASSFTASPLATDIAPPSVEAGDLRSQVHTLVDKALPSTLETVKALLEKRVL